MKERQSASGLSGYSTTSTTAGAGGPQARRGRRPAMRVAIREQLALLILLAALVGLAVISVPTWITSHDFVLSIAASLLSNIATLKAEQLASNLNLMQTTVSFVSTRIIIQGAVRQYNTAGDFSNATWAQAQNDMLSALRGTNSVGQQILLQSMLLPNSGTGPNGKQSLMNVTSNTHGQFPLPYNCTQGSEKGANAYLGMNYSQCGDLGYPRELYPNLTYIANDTNRAVYDGRTLDRTSALLLGPWQTNESFYLVSVTVPMINTNNTENVMAWLTFVMKWTLIQEVVNSMQDLGDTGLTLLLGPDNKTNFFNPDEFYKTDGSQPTPDFKVRFVIPVNDTDSSRHPLHTIGSANLPFQASRYPVVRSAISDSMDNADNSGSTLRTHNEAGRAIAAGYAVPQSPLVDWVIVVEMGRSEVWSPINRLRNILLACIFSTLGFIAIVSFPLAHYASRPIRRLREATERSIAPPGAEDGRYSFDSSASTPEPNEVDGGDGATAQETEKADVARKEGFISSVVTWRRRRRQREQAESRPEQQRRRQFRVPGRVKEHKHWIKDELSDLTATFNEMSDELMAQYEKLEDRVKQRTAELELSKKAAEAANESKTLFIANISHELKTPLNGIMGMCAVCMQEDDPLRLKRSLGTIYKSGDLLLHLLTDLLTFSKNQVGQQLSLDEKEFLLRDVSSQVLAIFEKQARESNIDLRVEWEGVQNLPLDHTLPEQTDFGPAGTGRLRNMVVYGDVQRILQVLMNLVSNSLKFTPAGGVVVMTIRCLSDVTAGTSRKGSMNSRVSRQTSARHKGSDATLASTRIETANSINPRDKPNALRLSQLSDQNNSPPPGKYLSFEFEVNDTGPGIPEEMQGKIFEPFMQGDLGLSKKHAGTGLGLSICSQLASLLRGTIGVQSIVGVGSTFKMQVPLRLVKSRNDSSASSGIDDFYEASNRSHGVSDDERNMTSRRLKDPMVDGQHSGSSTPRMPTSSSLKPPTVVSSAVAEPRATGMAPPFFQPTGVLESPRAAVKKIAADAKRSNKRVRVLVAEDNKVNQEVVCRMLKLEDVYDITVAKDGQEALDLVRASMSLPPSGPSSPSSGEIANDSNDNASPTQDPAAADSNGTSTEPPQTAPKPFNLIFMDVQMPNVDGLTSTRLIRAAGYQAPIVALTAFAEESNVRDCLASGMNYFLSKPIRRPQLKKVLKEYCPPIPEEETDDGGDAGAGAGAGASTDAVGEPKADGDGEEDASPGAASAGTGTSATVVGSLDSFSGGGDVADTGETREGPAGAVTVMLPSDGFKESCGERDLEDRPISPKGTS